MSKRTYSKIMRTKHEILGYREGIVSFDPQTKKPVVDQVPIPGKVAGYLPSEPVEIREVEWAPGKFIKVRISPGQRINMRKELKRQKKAGLL